MNFNNIRIILVGTTHAGNIGATARSMKTMGLYNLYLVGPQHFPDAHATALATNADDILEKCIVVPTLQQALQDCQLIFATSARIRAIDLPLLTPFQSAKIIINHELTTQIAIVFGREKSGLTNDELLQCNYHIHIPTSELYSSLNLSHSVQIICYELRMRYLKNNHMLTHDSAKDSHAVLATTNELSNFYEHLTELLVIIMFFKTKNHLRIERRIKRLFNRMKLESLEIKILRGIISKINYKLTNI